MISDATPNQPFLLAAKEGPIKPLSSTTGEKSRRSTRPLVLEESFVRTFLVDNYPLRSIALPAPPQGMFSPCTYILALTFVCGRPFARLYFAFADNSRLPLF